jgi:hypothetical protein
MTKICTKEDVQTFLTATMVEKKKVLVWTKSADESEFYYSEALVTKIIPGREIRIELEQPIQGHENQTIFLAIKEESFVMVSKIFSLVDKKVVIDLPSMAVGKERRRSPRRRFKYEDKIELTFSLANSKERLITHVLDISKHGMCVVMTKETLEKIIKTKFIHVDQSGQFQINGKCEMKSLRLLSNATPTRPDLYSVGFEFS